jgi:hypothetical protein
MVMMRKTRPLHLPHGAPRQQRLELLAGQAAGVRYLWLEECCRPPTCLAPTTSVSLRDGRPYIARRRPGLTVISTTAAT